MHGAFAEAQRVRLEGLRRTAREQWFDAELAGGRHETVVADLRAAVAESPLDTRLAALWMTALHRGGRTAEALEAYRVFRATRQHELGLEPDADLQALHRRILQGTTDRPVVVSRPVPEQLPPALPDFTGRVTETAWLRTALTGGPAGNGLTGLGGSGKTALAVHART